MASSAFSTTSADGEFEFGTKPSPQGQTVLWATHPDYVGEFVVLDRGLTPGDTGSLSITLEPASGLTALVTLASEPASGATVWQYGIPSPTSSGENARRALSALVRQFTTSKEGTATLHPFPGPVGARASRGELESRAQRSESQARILLPLYETFTASGFVVADPELSSEDEYLVEVLAGTGHFKRVIGSTTVRDLTEWGPISVPLLGDKEFAFTLRGGDAIPVTETRLAPAPGSELVVSFEARIGSRLWAIAADTEGVVLGHALITAEWSGRSPGSATRSAFPPGADAEGYVLFRGIPDGHVSLTARCEGYAPASVERIAVPEVEPATWELNLERASRVSGHVLYQGEPVEAFEICYWNDDTASGAWRKAFFDRADGSFELEDAPLGDVWLLATGLKAPRSSPVMVRVEQGESTEITLELQPGVTGQGTVIDRESAEGIPDATVQLYTSVEARNLAPWGSPAHTDANGSFSIDGLVEGMNTILVRADGYADAWGSFTVTGGRAEDLTVALVAPLSLNVVLRGVPPQEAASYIAQVTNDSSIGPLRFSEDGVATASPLAPGRYEVSLTHNGQPIRFASTQSPRGGNWELSFDVNMGPKLLVTVLPEEGEPLPYALALFARPMTTEMDRVEVATSVVDGQAILDGLPPGPVALSARGPKGELLGHTTAVLGTEDTLASLELGVRTLSLRIVDPRGAPMPLMRVGARGLGQAAGVPVVATTNGDGVASFDTLTPGDHELHVMHEEFGSMITTQVLDVSKNVPSIEFSADLRVTVRVRSRGEGVPDVLCEVACAADGRRLGASKTNLAGDAFIRRISSGEYTLSCRHPEYWLHEAVVVLAGASLDHEVELLPLGGLSLSFVNTAGVPANQVPVELELIKTGESVRSWVENGLLDAATQQATDAFGHLEIRGLPCGSYAWRAGGESGIVEATERAVGQVVVIP